MTWLKLPRRPSSVMPRMTPSPTSGRREAATLLFNAQRFRRFFHIMAHHVDIGGRGFRIRKRVGIERAADFAPVSAAMRWVRRGSAMFSKKTAATFSRLHGVDDVGDVAGAGFGFGGNALRRDEFEPVAGVK